jgi:hypothetical protein
LLKHCIDGSMPNCPTMAPMRWRDTTITTTSNRQSLSHHDLLRSNPTLEPRMKQQTLADAIRNLLWLPSAMAPIAMSTLALVVVLISVAVFGTAHEPDEGAAAHIWQLLVAGQLPVLLYFAARQLLVAFRPAVAVLSIQALALGAAIAPVYILHL